MSKIGQLEEVENKGDKELWGHIHTLRFSLTVRLVENRDFKSAPNTPDYKVLAKIGNGNETEVGGAWLRTPNSHESTVKEFLSIQIDDPSLMTEPLNVTAFPREKGLWDVTFRRRKAA